MFKIELQPIIVVIGVSEKIECVPYGQYDYFCPNTDVCINYMYAIQFSQTVPFSK